MSTYFKAMSVLGCETDRLRSRSVCKHNCCDGENCVSWLGEKFQELQAYEDTNLMPAEIKDHEEMFKAYRHVCGGLSPDDIERMKAELEQYKAQQWIPVEEKLPEVNVDVLVICKNGLTFVAYHREWEFTGEVIWNTRGPLGSGRRIATARITHWTPLPEPPKEAALDAQKG